jgi:hypothetical protein
MRDFFVRWVFPNDKRADNFIMRVAKRYPELRFMATGLESLVNNPLGHLCRSAADYGTRAYSLAHKSPLAARGRDTYSLTY